MFRQRKHEGQAAAHIHTFEDSEAQRLWNETQAILSELGENEAEIRKKREEISRIAEHSNGQQKLTRGKISGPYS